MTNPCTIPTNFHVPKRCRHEFSIYWNDLKAGSIVGVPGKRQIEFRTWDFPCTKKEAKQFTSRSYDWMAESIEHLRWICEQ